MSGTIFVNSATRVDSDVNDPLADFRDNGNRNDAQPLINPVVVGGYANLPGGRRRWLVLSVWRQSGFLQPLICWQGQLLTLVMADDPFVNDLDLYLYDEQGVLIDASLGINELEQLVVPADGNYSIGVSVFAGASNYRLSTGIGEVARGNRSPALE